MNAPANNRSVDSASGRNERSWASAAKGSPVTAQAEIEAYCRHCRQCVRECSFLGQHGTPGEIACRSREGASLEFAFGCSLCTLCTQLCPLDLEPAQMFLQFRRDLVAAGRQRLSSHWRLLLYEQLGSRAPLRFHHLPENCTTLFFPGCALPGFRPAATYALYRWLIEQQPTLGIMLDCCQKISHDLGRPEEKRRRVASRQSLLDQAGVTEIITACPSCLKMLAKDHPNLKITSVYTLLADSSGIAGAGPTCTSPLAIHDPCTSRFSQQMHRDIREILERVNIPAKELLHSMENTLCCGEGGGAGCLGGQNSGWHGRRLVEAASSHLLTYCAGCYGVFENRTEVSHILDHLHLPLSDRAKRKLGSSRNRYVNRWRLRNLLATTCKT